MSIKFKLIYSAKLSRPVYVAGSIAIVEVRNEITSKVWQSVFNKEKESRVRKAEGIFMGESLL